MKFPSQKCPKCRLLMPGKCPRCDYVFTEADPVTPAMRFEEEEREEASNEGLDADALVFIETSRVS